MTTEATAATTAPGSGFRCSCPCCDAASGITLLMRDRPAMALTVLQDLPERIRNAMAVAHEQGRRDLAAELADIRPITGTKPAKQRRAWV